MKNPGTPYRLEMRADSLSSNEEVSHTYPQLENARWCRRESLYGSRKFPRSQTRMRTQSSAGAGPRAANHGLLNILLAQRHWGGATEISRSLAPYKDTVARDPSLFFVKTRELWCLWLRQAGLGRHRTGPGVLRPRSVVEPGLGP